MAGPSFQKLETGNCYRCGREFLRDGQKRICPNCRRSAALPRMLNPKLSFRERQVVQLITLGRLNKQIGSDLHLTEGTIKEYLNRIFRKVGVSNRTELAVWAVMQKVSQIDGHVS